MSAKPKPKPRSLPTHLMPDSGSRLATYPLLRAVYMDETDRARAILAADPQQVNLQDPFAGLTALHIAIFRQNLDTVRLLAGHPECNTTIRDNFGRTASDMLAYTSSRVIFDLVTRRAAPEIERSWLEEAFDLGRATRRIVPIRRDDPSP